VGQRCEMLCSLLGACLPSLAGVNGNGWLRVGPLGGAGRQVLRWPGLSRVGSSRQGVEVGKARASFVS